MSNASLKPITVWGHTIGPNPLKVRMVLEELGVPHEFKIVEFGEMKQEPFISLNPNGRVPAIEDPNTGLTLWESGPIVEYLVDQYDKDHKISYDSFTEKYQIKQWIGFQISGQGPYYGQGAWFAFFHHEKLPSAVERYFKEAERVRSVLDLHLSRRAGEKQGQRVANKDAWLVGDKITVADLSWFIWEQIISFTLARAGASFWHRASTLTTRPGIRRSRSALVRSTLFRAEMRVSRIYSFLLRPSRSSRGLLWVRNSDAVVSARVRRAEQFGVSYR